MKSILLIIASLAIAYAQWVPVLVRDFSTIPLLGQCREWGLRKTMIDLKANNTIPNVLYNLANTENVYNYTTADVINWKYNCTMRSFDNTITIRDNFIVEYNYTTQQMRILSQVLMVTGPGINYTDSYNNLPATIPTPDDFPVVSQPEPTPTPVPEPEPTPVPVPEPEPTPEPVPEPTPEPEPTPSGPSTVVSRPWTPSGPYTLVQPNDYSRWGLSSVNGSIAFGIDYIARNATAMGLIPAGSYVRDEVVVMYRQIHRNWCVYNTTVNIRDAQDTVNINAHFWVNYSMPVERREVLAFEYTVLA